MSDTNYTVLYNDSLVTILIHTGNVSSTSTFQEFHTVLNDNWIKPSYHVCTLDKNGDCVIRANGENGKIGFKNVRNTSQSLNAVYGEIVYKIR